MENKIQDSRILIDDINSPIRSVYKIPIENIKSKKWWQFWKKDTKTLKNLDALYGECITLDEEKEPDDWHIVGRTNQYDNKIFLPIDGISREDAEKELAKLISNYKKEIIFDGNADIPSTEYEQSPIIEPIDTSNIVGIFAINNCYDNISTINRMIVDITSEKNTFGIPYDILIDNENECTWYIFYTTEITIDKKTIINNILETEPSKFWQ